MFYLPAKFTGIPPGGIEGVDIRRIEPAPLRIS